MEDVGFAALIEGLFDDDPHVRCRSADQIEKVSLEQPRLLDPYASELIGLMPEASPALVRWHLALVAPRMKLSARNRERAIAALQDYLGDRSSITKTNALEGLARLAPGEETTELLHRAAKSGTPAMKARARILLARDISSLLGRT